MSKTTPDRDPRYPAEPGYVWAKAECVEGLARINTLSLPSMPAWTVVYPDPAAPDATATPAATPAAAGTHEEISR